MEESNCNSYKFGVKSYLHHFYEDCSGIGLCEVQQPVHKLSIKRRNCQWFVCFVLPFVGFTTASVGLSMFVFGAMNKPFLDAIAIIGAALLCVGGVTLAVSLTYIKFEIMKQEQEMLEHQHFQERCKKGLSVFNEEKSTDSPPSSPSSFHPGDLPVSLYQISAVQPLLENQIPLDSHDTAGPSPTFSSSSDQ